MKAKIISKVSKVILALMLVTMFIVKWLGYFHASASDIIACCFAAYGIVAGTIDINISLDKILEVINGKKPLPRCADRPEGDK